MKSILFIFVLLGAHACFATSDFERGLIFIGNSASGGTYLAGLESQKAKITLEYQRQTAEMKVAAESQYHDQLKSILSSEISQLESLLKELSVSLKTAQETQSSLGVISELLGDVYNSKMSFEQLRQQLEERGKILRSLNTEWKDLVSEQISSAGSSAVTISNLNAVLLAALDREAENSYIIRSLETKIQTIQDQINAFKKRLGELQ